MEVTALSANPGYSEVTDKPINLVTESVASVCSMAYSRSPRSQVNHDEDPTLHQSV